MVPLGDPLTTRPIQMGWEISIEPCPIWLFWYIDNPAGQFVNGLVPTRTWTPSYGLDPMPTLDTICYGCEVTWEFDTGVACASLRIKRIPPLLPPECKIQRIQARLHNPGWMDHCHVRHGRFEAVPILDPVDVDEALGQIASRYHSLQWHVQS